MKENTKTQQNNNILFLGHGYVAQYFCKSYHLDSFDIGVSINKSKDKYFKTPNNVKTIKFSEIDSSVLDNYHNFVISIPPFYQLKTDIIIDKFYNYFLKRQTPYKLIYLSATSVYGNHNGKKVQENSELKAKSTNGLARIECEKKYLQLQQTEETTQKPDESRDINQLTEKQLANIIILRLAGIYGNKRNKILSIQNKELTHNKSSNKLISRAHVADIAAIIKEIILSSKIKNEIFNIADNQPSTTNEVNNYICEALLKIDKLPISDDVTEYRHSSFALDNKIVDNEKLKKILNYKFIFPSYKEGFIHIAKELNLTLT